MEIVYDYFRAADENYTDEDTFDEDDNPDEIKIKFNDIELEEKKLLDRYNIEYSYTTDNKVEIITGSCVYFIVKITSENKGIFLEKTENYYNFFKKNYSPYKLKEENINLVISKEDCRVELIFVDGTGGFKNEL